MLVQLAPPVAWYRSPRAAQVVGSLDTPPEHAAPTQQLKGAAAAAAHASAASSRSARLREARLA